MPTAAPLKTLIAAAMLTLCACGAGAEGGTGAGARPAGLADVTITPVADGMVMPRFKVDPHWPRLGDLAVGQVSGVSLDSKGNIWIVQRRDSIRDLPAGKTAALHVLQLAPDGSVLRNWGGPAHAPEIDGVNQWPGNVHGLFVDADDTLWIGGNGPDDHVVIHLDAQGRYLGQIGRRGQTGGNMDRALLGGPADIYRDADGILVADGYTNKRVIGFDAADGAFQGYWGAFGTVPDAPSREGDFDQSMASSNSDGGADLESRMFGDIVHCVTRSAQGDYYVCDRRNNRVQIFRRDDAGALAFTTNLAVAPETGGLRTASDVAFSPDGKYMYIADMQNERVWILLRETNQYLGHFGSGGKAPGQFIWLHSLAVDSEGNLFTTEVNGGQRIQKFVLTGVE